MQLDSIVEKLVLHCIDIVGTISLPRNLTSPEKI
jgi:hypothetical protein